jgi:hypothetical protein
VCVAAIARIAASAVLGARTRLNKRGRSAIPALGLGGSKVHHPHHLEIICVLATFEIYLPLQSMDPHHPQGAGRATA